MMMLAHLAHYLSNNQAPSEDDAREIKALREKPLEELSTINVEIERIESILNSLKRKRANIQKSIDECDTILAPVRRPPLDVWCVIFVHCLATHRNPIMSASEAPILLTQVCRGWRSIALSTPQIWSKLYIPLLQRSSLSSPFESEEYIQKDQRRFEARSDEVQKWLQLSATCPLSISMNPRSTLAPYKPLLDDIVQSSRRWQQLELGYLSPFSVVSEKILSLSADDLCMLRVLRLESTETQETDKDWYQCGLLTAQSLRSISIATLHLTNMFPTGIPPNWKHLNHLFIHSHIATQFANEILIHCSNLVACLLAIEAPDDMNVIFIPPIIPSITLPSSFLPHLEFLSLQGHPISCSQLFSSIEAPCLRILDCHGDIAHENEGGGLFTFLQRVKSLKTLMMDYRGLTGDNTFFFKCCTLIPSLTHLVLGWPQTRSLDSYWWPSPHEPQPDESRLLAMLYEVKHQHSPASTPTLLPSLETLEAYGIPGVTDEELLKFIVARINASKLDPSKLKKVLIRITRSRQIDIVPEALAYAYSAGIDLDLELTYTERRSHQSWSPSFGLTNDISWPHQCFDY